LIVLLRSVSAALTHVVVMPAMGRGISRGRALRFPFSLQPRRGPALSNDASARMRRSPNKLLRCRSRRIGSERGWEVAPFVRTDFALFKAETARQMSGRALPDAYRMSHAATWGAV